MTLYRIIFEIVDEAIPERKQRQLVTDRKIMHTTEEKFFAIKNYAVTLEDAE